MSEHKKKSPVKASLTLALLIAVLGTAAFGLHAFVSKDDLSQCDKRPGKGKCAPAGAIIVVSGGDTRARTNEAIGLYKRGWAELLIVSGAAKDKNSPSNAEVMQAHAVEQGVPPGDILIDAMAGNTLENATGAAQLAQARGVQEIIVVTSPYHLRRTTLLFERQFAEVRGHPSSEDKNWSSKRWWLTESGWRLVTSELVKYALELTRGGSYLKPPSQE